MSKKAMTLSKFAIARGASAEFVDWLGERDLAEAWATCRRSDWMLWLLLALGWDDYHAQREYAWWCATQVRHLMTDPRSTECLDVVRKFLDGEATAAELLRSAVGAREVAVDLADSARAASVAAAWSAEVAASWSAWSASDAAWAAAAAAGGTSSARAAQADRLRQLVPVAAVQAIFDKVRGGAV